MKKESAEIRRRIEEIKKRVENGEKIGQFTKEYEAKWRVVRRTIGRYKRHADHQLNTERAKRDAFMEHTLEEEVKATVKEMIRKRQKMF
jgi:hypothetical protein